MKRALLGLWLAGAGVVAGALPSVEMFATSTNLVVSEETTVRVVLSLPPLADELEQYQPFLSQRPPHVSAAFLEAQWNGDGVLARTEQSRPPFLQQVDRNRGSAVFSLNQYAVDGFSALARGHFGGRNPFDDDMFDGMMGPQRARFPFLSSRELIDGKNAWVFSFDVQPLRAVKAGRVTLAPVEVKVSVIEGVKRTRDRFGRAVNVPSLKELTLRSRSLVFDVVEPPVTGRPSSYCGAIGRGMSVKASLDTAVCKAGDPLMLTLEVAGVRDLASVRAPSFGELLAAGEVFRLDENSLKVETLAESRRFTWRVRAMKAGTVEFPALAVAYFDSAKRAYVEKRTTPIPVQVKAGVQVALGTVNAAGEEENVGASMPMPDGIDLDPRGVERVPLVPHALLAFLLFAIPPMLYTVLRLVPPVRRRMQARAAAYRHATAFAKALRGLRHADGVRRAQAARQFIATRYDVNAAAVTAADAMRLMANDFTDSEIMLVTEALADFDRMAFSAKKTVVSLLVVLLGFAACAGTATDFSYRRANALATKAVTEADFRKAATAYVGCVSDGSQNPIIFTNLGNCWVLAGNPRAALLAYDQAERWSGETASTRRGIRAAMARCTGDPRADMPFAHVFARPHVIYSLDTRLVFTTAAWALIWFVLLLPPGGMRRLLLTVCVCACLAGTVSVMVSSTEAGYAGKAIEYGEAIDFDKVPAGRGVANDAR